jgi:UDP-GlcNAc3NAcA epimerase
MKIISIVGARPQFVKLAPLCSQLRNFPEVEHFILHTGQHYDYRMSKIFFDQLGIPEPDWNLDIGSGTHGWQTAEMVKKIEQVLLEEKPDWVLVYGDTNSTLSGALAAVKLHIPVAHIEAGLRSYNRMMPEEINRVLTDHCSTVLFCPTKAGMDNLSKEGMKGRLIFDNGRWVKAGDERSVQWCAMVGDLMHEVLKMSLDIADRESTILPSLGLYPDSYYVVTVHRAENTDNPENFLNILEGLARVSKFYPVIFPIHPRTKKLMEQVKQGFVSADNIKFIDPVSYFDMLVLVKNARAVLTDSGGLQKEAYILGTPCVTLRGETEWVETVEIGWNVLVGADPQAIENAVLKKDALEIHPQLYGDGKTSQYIVEILRRFSELTGDTTLGG